LSEPGFIGLEDFRMLSEPGFLGLSGKHEKTFSHQVTKGTKVHKGVSSSCILVYLGAWCVKKRPFHLSEPGFIGLEDFRMLSEPGFLGLSGKQEKTFSHQVTKGTKVHKRISSSCSLNIRSHTN
jgi:hypothetical protein